jgi:hypothetical protein
MGETRSQQEQNLIAWASTLTKKDALTAFIEQFLVTTPADQNFPASTTRTHKISWNSAKKGSPQPTPRCGGTKSQRDSEVEQPNGVAITHNSRQHTKT